jgi:hypothetical protein
VRKPPAPPPPPRLPPPPPPTTKYDKLMLVFVLIIPDFVEPELGINLYTVYPFCNGFVMVFPFEFKYIIV